jgi:CBS domain containing-hemolysin-like protein
MNNKNWVIKAFILTFFLALIISGISNIIVEKAGFIVLLLITIVIIFVGIIADIIGTAVLTANEATFHAKASNKISGSKESIKLIKNSSNIANFCNDIIGDICGIVSGSMGTMIAIYTATRLTVNNTLTTLLISSIISSIMVGGKAIGKNIAVKRSDEIIFFVGNILSKFNKK